MMDTVQCMQDDRQSDKQVETANLSMPVSAAGVAVQKLKVLVSQILFHTIKSVNETSRY